MTTVENHDRDGHRDLDRDRAVGLLRWRRPLVDIGRELPTGQPSDASDFGMDSLAAPATGWGDGDLD